MTSASAGKIGFCSSGSTRPISRARCPRSLLGRSYPSTSRAVSTASLVLSDTPGLAVEHPAHGGLADPDLLRHLGEPPGRSTFVMPQEYVISTQVIALSERYLTAPPALTVACGVDSQAEQIVCRCQPIMRLKSIRAYECCVFAREDQDLASRCPAMYVPPNGDGARTRLLPRRTADMPIAHVQPKEGMER